MSCSAIISLGGSTANWWEAFCACVSLAFRKHTTQAMSPHWENYGFAMDFQVNPAGECCLLVL